MSTIHWGKGIRNRPTHSHPPEGMTAAQWFAEASADTGASHTKPGHLFVVGSEFSDDLFIAETHDEAMAMFREFEAEMLQKAHEQRELVNQKKVSLAEHQRAHREALEQLAAEAHLQDLDAVDSDSRVRVLGLSGRYAYIFVSLSEASEHKRYIVKYHGGDDDFHGRYGADEVDRMLSYVREWLDEGTASDRRMNKTPGGER